MADPVREAARALLEAVDAASTPRCDEPECAGLCVREAADALRAALSRPAADAEAVRKAIPESFNPTTHPLRDEALRWWKDGYCRQATVTLGKHPPSPFADFMRGFVAGRETAAAPLPASAEAVREAVLGETDAEWLLRQMAKQDLRTLRDIAATFPRDREAPQYALPLPASDEVAMPDEVPSAGAFREAFKNAALPRGADYASWASGYCAGWTAAERAAKGGAS